MWDDARQLNAASATLAAIAIVFVAIAAVTWLVRRPWFAIREVAIVTPLARASGAHLQSVVRGELVGTFFTLDLDRAQSALSEVPWVRGVALRRQWPHRLEIEVDEHVPLARWNDNGLVDADGSVFVADLNVELPQFVGPDGQSEAMAARYREWAAMLSPLGLTVRTLSLSARGGWRIDAVDANGPLAIELGRDDASGRLARFIAAHDRTLGALARSGRSIEQVDLRYRNGFAVRVPGFRELPKVVRKS